MSLMVGLNESLGGEQDYGLHARHNDFDNSPNKLNSLRMVVMEMTLAFFGVVFNLIVLISIREKESLLNSTVNVLLANLCFANLVAAVFVKSIAVIYNGYAVATSVWEVELAFCTIHTVSFRATWAVFPYTIVVLCWNGLIIRLQKVLRVNTHSHEDFDSSGPTAIVKSGYRTGTAVAGVEEDNNSEQNSLKTRFQSSIEVPSGIDSVNEVEVYDEGIVNQEHQHGHGHDKKHEVDLPDQGAYGRNKIALGFIWSISGAYSMISNEIMSKERIVPCSLKQELSDELNLISLLVAVGIPFLLGPVLCPIIHLVITCCKLCCCCDTCVRPQYQHRNQYQYGDDRSPEHHYTPEDCVNCACLVECGLIVLMILIFVVTYPTHMYVTEVFLASLDTHFAFMAFKYCFGCLHLVLVPVLVLLIKSDIRSAASDVFLKRSAESSKSNEMTFEQLQTHVGIGVHPGSS